MAIDFCVDRFVNGQPYPNLAVHKAVPYTASWRQFSTHWPYSEPVMLFKYLENSGIPVNYVDLDHSTKNTFYPVALSFFDFSVNWFSLFSAALLQRLRQCNLTLLFFYSEGDNPVRIQSHIYSQAYQYNVLPTQIKFVSANSSAANLANFYHFVDDEVLFQTKNQVAPVQYHTQLRSKKYTALVRMHKYWRANTMSTIWAHNLHHDGYFGYGVDVLANETESDNPIEVDSFDRLRLQTRQFIDQCPFFADHLSSNEHNDHTVAYTDHYSNSYLNIVLESHMDVDQSHGVLLTEKTFKPIKNAQPFIIFGAHHSLQLLRDLGYRTFDSVIDNHYDTIANTTERWRSAINLTLQLIKVNIADLHQLYCSLESDIKHNQELFLENKRNRLEKLVKELTSESYQ